MLKILMGPNVKILMGQSFGSWTHGHGPMAWAQGQPMCPGAKVLAHEYFDFLAYLILAMSVLRSLIIVSHV